MSDAAPPAGRVAITVPGFEVGSLLGLMRAQFTTLIPLSGDARFASIRRSLRLRRTTRDSPGKLGAEQKYLSAVIRP